MASVRARPLPRKRTDRTQNPNVLDALAPDWGLDAADWIADQEGQGWASISLLIGIVVTLLGGALLIGGGYTSIQGVRLPLADLKLKIETEGIPTFWWWLIPIANTFIQIIAKKLRGLRGLWRTSMLFDGATSAIWIAWALSLWFGVVLISNTQPLWIWTLPMPTPEIIGVGVIAAGLGLATAVFAEQFFLAGLCMLRGALERREEE